MVGDFDAVAAAEPVSLLVRQVASVTSIAPRRVLCRLPVRYRVQEHESGHMRRAP
jgi:hypothetical protein